MSKNKVFIVIPCYNEAKVIAKLIKDIKKEGWRNIIVVDDGSTDNTFQQAKKEGAVVLRHLINRGKGAAVKTGLEFAKRKGALVVVTIDGDGQNSPKEIKKLVEEIKKGPEVVMGSRFANKQNKIPAFNKIANIFANFLIFLLYGIMVSDSQSGFRAYSKKAIDLLDLRFDRYEFDSEVIREIAKNKLSYKEVPIEVFYTKYSLSKMQKQNLTNGIKTMIKMITSV